MQLEAFTFILVISALLAPHSYAQSELQIVTTTSILKDVVERVAGDFAEVTSLMPNGADPHSYMPTAEDASLLGSADYVVFIGGNAEEGMSESLESIEMEGRGIALLEALPDSFLIRSDEDSDHGHGGYDPHFWLSPKMMNYSIAGLEEELLEKFPEYATSIQTNAAKLQEDLESLHLEISKRLSEVPPTDRILVTPHSAFKYWARDYNFTQVSLEGVSTSDEASISDIESLAQYIKNNKIKVIFNEADASESSMQSVIDQAKVLGWNVVIGGTLYPTSFGEETGGTYIDLIKYNSFLVGDSISNPPTDAGSVSAPFSPLPVVAAMFVVTIVQFIYRRRRKLL